MKFKKRSCLLNLKVHIQAASAEQEAVVGFPAKITIERDYAKQ